MESSLLDLKMFVSLLFYIPISCSPNVFCLDVRVTFGGPGTSGCEPCGETRAPAHFFENQWHPRKLYKSVAKTGILKKPPEAKAHCSTRGQGHLHPRPRPPPRYWFRQFLRIFPCFLPCFIVSHKVFLPNSVGEMKRKDDLFTRVLRTFKDLQETTHILPKATNSHVTPFSPSNLSESHSHASPVGLHGHQLQLIALCLGFGSKSCN